jgi:predicted GIY-YIG superfamily endonuclease|uniref:GIY-YIG domain-containing protein n=1 Tax=viral metagenome TaxID=1070528 RepID=A0A6C0BFV4_9ZZZZ
MVYCYCYILYNVKDNKTYNGYTVDLKKRIRQHNNIIKGGAKYTTTESKQYGSNHWKYLCIVTCDMLTKHEALSLEWHIRYPTGVKPRPSEYKGPLGRIKSIYDVLCKDKFKDKLWNIYIDESYIPHFEISWRDIVRPCSEILEI